MNLSSIQRRALFKIAVDLVKSDNQIHCNEIVTLQKIQEVYGLDTEETDMIHYLTLQESIEILASLSIDEKQKILLTLENLITVDNNIDFHEKLLLSGVRLHLLNSNDAKIISCQDGDMDCDAHQIVYLEHTYCDEAHTVLDDKYDYMMLSNVLSNSQMQFFYLPKVIQLLLEGNIDRTTNILKKSIEYLVPSAHVDNLEYFRDSLQNMDVVKFTKLVETQANIRPEQVGMEAFLMISLQDSFILDDDAMHHRMRDYLCINATNKLKSIVLKLVELMQTPNISINYYGYYRLLFDFLNTDVHLMSKILIDNNYNFVLSDIGGDLITFKSAPQAKTLYLLLIYYNKGITQSLWNTAENLGKELVSRTWEDILHLKTFLSRQGDEAACLIYNIITIYEIVSNRSVDSARLLEYTISIISHRSSLKNYINAAINKIEKLAHKDFYLVEFDPFSESYRVQLNVDWVQLKIGDFQIALSVSDLWNKLIKFSKRLE